MDRFWEGFGKKAADDGNGPLQVAAIPAGTAAGYAGLVTSLPVADIAISTDEKIDSGKAQKLIKEVDKRIGHGHAPDTAFYVPQMNTIFSGGKMERPSMIAHEIGHALTTKNPLAKLRILFQQLHGGIRVGRYIIPAYNIPAAVLPGAATLSKKTEDAAPYLGLAYASPVLLDEAQASAVGLYQLAKKRGLGAAARGVLPLTAALGTYAAVPLASGLTAKYITHLKRKNKKDPDR